MKKTKMMKKNYEFRNVLSKGKYYSGKYIEAFIKDNNKKCNYLGLAISVKYAKAVERNRIKRLIRENYKIMEDHIKDGKSIVFLVKKKSNSEDINFDNIYMDISSIFLKSNIKNKGN